MRLCECESPVESSDPHTNGSCAKCGASFGAEWYADDATVREFYDRLGLAMGGEPSYPHFRLLAEAREKAGRPLFGLRYLNRDNVADAAEEAADGANYALFEQLQCKRRGADPADDLILDAARHFALAYAALAAAQHKHRGAP